MKRKTCAGNILTITLSLLSLSIMIRLGGGFAEAQAQNEQTARPGSIAQIAEPVLGCAPLPSALAAEFSDREAKILAKEVFLDERAAAADVAEQLLRGKVEELRQAEEKLRATMALASVAAENDLAKMTAVYEAMRPKDAAALFDNMDADFSAGFFSRMRPEAAAPILAGMAPEKAYAVSAIVAGRNARVPKN